MSADLQRFRALIGKAATAAPLSFDEAREAFTLMMAGDATPAQMAGLLMAMRVRGESVDEIAAGATVMRERMTRIRAPADAFEALTRGDAFRQIVEALVTSEQAAGGVG